MASSWDRPSRSSAWRWTWWSSSRAVAPRFGACECQRALPSLRGANGSCERAPDDRLRDEAIQSVSADTYLDCFASLAMTSIATVPPGLLTRGLTPASGGQDHTSVSRRRRRRPRSGRRRDGPSSDRQAGDDGGRAAAAASCHVHCDRLRRNMLVLPCAVVP